MEKCTIASIGGDETYYKDEEFGDAQVLLKADICGNVIFTRIPDHSYYLELKLGAKEISDITVWQNKMAFWLLQHKEFYQMTHAYSISENCYICVFSLLSSIFNENSSQWLTEIQQIYNDCAVEAIKVG